MAIPTVNISFNGYSDQRLNLETLNILDKMDKNPNFPDATPYYNDVKDAQTTYSASLPPAIDGSRADIAIKNANKAVLADKLQRLAMYVNVAANGNMAALLTTGIQVRKEKSAQPDLGKPEGVKAVNGKNSGEMNVTVADAVGASSFMYQYTLDPITDDSVWISEGDTAKKHTFYGLTPGTKVWFRVVAIGRYSQQMISEVVAAIVI
jgi:hypothetical protein